MSSLSPEVPCELWIDGVGGSWLKQVNLPCVPQAEQCFYFEHLDEGFTVSSCFFSEDTSGEFNVVVLFDEAITEEASDEQMIAHGWEWVPEHEEATDGTQAR